MLLRGWHEVSRTNRACGFFDQCKKHYSVRLWKRFQDLFSWLPLAATVGEAIFLVHGGLWRNCISLDQIRTIQRAFLEDEDGMLLDLLLAKPSDEHQGWEWLGNGDLVFGSDIVQDFLSRSNLKMIVRTSRQPVDGPTFSADQRMVTLFSAFDFRGGSESDATVMTIDAHLECSFWTIKYAHDPPKPQRI
eukprot:TRINITY_DN7864_c0_g1_i2.p1 TRINITY_DN7864_c0_g1~~TRINITY_DN7864_c0_g1_i2.p1  ORF type:complete len:190 (+),score=6.28 TRINITY_DN7864_c0_g1_i2:190-759(+)